MKVSTSPPGAGGYRHLAVAPLGGPKGTWKQNHEPPGIVAGRGAKSRIRAASGPRFVTVMSKKTAVPPTSIATCSIATSAVVVKLQSVPPR